MSIASLKPGITLRRGFWYDRNGTGAGCGGVRLEFIGGMVAMDHSIGVYFRVTRLYLTSEHF